MARTGHSTIRHAKPVWSSGKPWPPLDRRQRGRHRSRGFACFEAVKTFHLEFCVLSFNLQNILSFPDLLCFAGFTRVLSDPLIRKSQRVAIITGRGPADYLYPRSHATSTVKTPLRPKSTRGNECPWMST